MKQKSDAQGTPWSVILRAQGTNPEERRAALGELIRRYEGTVEAFLRRRRIPPSATPEDLKQEFFTQVLRLNDIDKLDRDRGRFRNWLFRAVSRFLSNAWDKWKCQRDGNGVTEPLLSDVAHAWTPEHLFMSQFAAETLRHVIRVHEAMAKQENRGDQFQILKRFLPGPAMAPGDFDAIAAELGVTVPHLRVKVHRLQSDHREYLRAAVADTLDLKSLDPESARAVELEMRLLYRALCETPRVS